MNLKVRVSPPSLSSFKYRNQAPLGNLVSHFAALHICYTPCKGLEHIPLLQIGHLSLDAFSIAACAAASLATGTRNGEHET